MNLSRLYIPAFALLVCGYPFTTISLELLDLPVGSFNVFLKAFYAGLFLLSLLVSFKSKRTSIPLMTIPLFTFFLLFGLRLIFDITIRGVYAPLSSPFYTLSYFFLLTLLPALSIAVSYNKSDIHTLNAWVQTILFLSCAMILVEFQQSETQFLLAIASSRLEIRDEGETAAVLNPITIGIVGSALAAMSFGQLSLKTEPSERLRVILSIVGIPLGLAALLLSGSRGPLLAFAVSMLFLILAIIRMKILRSAFRSNLSYRIYLLIMGIIVAFPFAFLKADTMFIALSRLISTITKFNSGGQTEARVMIAIDAFEGFSKSPFLGSGHLALGGTTYPHNSILEALMATGLFGTIIFIGSLVIVFGQIWRGLTLRLDPQALPLAPIVISMLILSLFSSSISQAPEIWVTAFLFLTIASRSKKRFRTLRMIEPLNSSAMRV